MISDSSVLKEICKEPVNEIEHFIDKQRNVVAFRVVTDKVYGNFGKELVLEWVHNVMKSYIQRVPWNTIALSSVVAQIDRADLLGGALIIQGHCRWTKSEAKLLTNIFDYFETNGFEVKVMSGGKILFAISGKRSK